jgi:hypothetical protein
MRHAKKKLPIRKPEGKGPFEKLRRKWEYNNKINLKNIG